MKELFIGIDLAWGEKNLSGFALLEKSKDRLYLRDIKLLHTLDDIISHISPYLTCKVSIGIDAALVIPNEYGNREIEKAFNRDFSAYKIAMLPINRTLLKRYSATLRSETLYKQLFQMGFRRDRDTRLSLFEVYTHSTIALCFNNNAILPYKRKKGRDTPFIQKHLSIYQGYLKGVIASHHFFEEDISTLRGQALKHYEDRLDAITCAYTLYYCKKGTCKYYTIEGIDTLVTPI